MPKTVVRTSDIGKSSSQANVPLPGPSSLLVAAKTEKRVSSMCLCSFKLSAIGSCHRIGLPPSAFSFLDTWGPIPSNFPSLIQPFQWGVHCIHWSSHGGLLQVRVISPLTSWFCCSCITAGRLVGYVWAHRDLPFSLQQFCKQLHTGL